jgi:hypothetical protein
LLVLVDDSLPEEVILPRVDVSLLEEVTLLRVEVAFLSGVFVRLELMVRLL